MATRTILDVDTGTDDAVALMVAALSPDWIGLPDMPAQMTQHHPARRA